MVDIKDGTYAAPESIKEKSDPFSELGKTGLVYSSGFVRDDINRELQGQVGMRRYREMIDNWALVTGILRIIEFACRQVDVRIEPYLEKDQDQPKKDDEENADFLTECLDDMSMSWSDILSEIMSMVGYGFTPMEIVYKKREGWDASAPGSSSKHDDGRIGWRKFAIRGQETIFRWDLDENGGVQGLIQMPAPNYRQIYIPIEKLLIFRTASNRGNPEGKSWLRGVWYDWYHYKRLTELAAIRVERDATGIPIAEVPSQVLQDSTMKAAWQNIVENLRQDEQAGLLIPQEYDPETRLPRFKLSLMSSPGQTQSDVNVLIQRHMQMCAIALMADFVLLGHEQAGSWALADNKTGLFAKAIGGLLDSVIDVLNRHAVPRLWALNALPMDRMPKIARGDLEARDFEQVATFLQKLSASGALLWPNKPLEDALLESANLPIRPEDERDTGITLPTMPGQEVGPDGKPLKPGEKPPGEKKPKEDDSKETPPKPEDKETP